MGNIGNPKEVIMVPTPVRAPATPMKTPAPVHTPVRTPVTVPERELVPLGR